MKKRISFLLLISIFSSLYLFAQKKEDYSAYFEEAYNANPSIPVGLLESIAYTNTRMHHVKPGPIANCSGLPQYYGVMGLVEDGGGYFKNNLQMVASLSGYSVTDIKNSPRINILAYAKAYSKMQKEKDMDSRGVEEQQNVMGDLSELPNDGSVINEYARDQQFYSVLKQVETYSRDDKGFDYAKIFGEDKVAVLTAKSVNTNGEMVVAEDGSIYTGERNADGCTPGKAGPDYKGAIWSPANPRNYGSRGGEKPKYITIHTIQGSYASAISWFRNPAAKVSAHYCIRASDGQVTQMVCEKDKAYHVRNDNAGAIGLEHEGFIEDGGSWYTNEMYESSAALVRDICKRNEIDPLKMYNGKPTNGKMWLSNNCRRIKGHQHFEGNDHIDPGKFWDWDRFYRLVNGEMPADRQILKEASGEIVDDGGKTGNYGAQKRVAYFIQPSGATSITLQFKQMDLEADAKTAYDFIDIYAGKNPSGEYIGRFAGKTLPKPITIKGSSVYIEFLSDCQIEGAGFEITYSSNATTVSAEVVKNPKIGNIYPFGASLNWDNAPASDKYLVYLKNTIDDKWTAYETRNNYIDFTGLATNRNYIWRIKNIVKKDTSAVESDKFTTPSPSRSGNAQTYTTTVENGKLYDSGGPESGYSPNEEYTYRIIPGNGGKVKITFKSFETEPDNDILYLYDGDSKNSPLLAKLSGSNLEKKEFISTKNGLTMYFKSTKSNHAKGWSADWATIGGGPSSGGGVVVVTPSPDNNGSTHTGGSSGGSSGGNTGGGSGSNTGGGNSTVPTFAVNLGYDAKSPEVVSKVPSVVIASQTEIAFDDIDKSGKGIANMFYLVAVKPGKSWKGNMQQGFFYEDFEGGLTKIWKTVSGKWDVKNGVLRQTDAAAANANIYAELPQDPTKNYLYQWNARVTGSESNKRSGFHFFCDAPTAENRGNSYFIWVREKTEGDKIELYKTDGTTNKFDMKSSADIKLDKNKAYNFKVIYYPSMGRIVVYVDNKFAMTWTDDKPLINGKAISMRAAGGMAEFDDIKVFESRGKKIKIAMDSDFAQESLDKKTMTRLISLNIDKDGKWSKEIAVETVVKKEGDIKGGSTGGGNAGTGTHTGGGTTPPPNGGNVAVFQDDFTLNLLPSAEAKQTFFVVADYNGTGRYGNAEAGFAYDEFKAAKMNDKWQVTAGKWAQTASKLTQTDENFGNAGISLPMKQQKGKTYLYHFKTKLLTAGDNKRFGFHFFASDAAATNKGDSYFVWFRNNDTKEDKIEVYRSIKNELKDNASAVISIQKEAWYDVKIVFESATAQITVWLNDKKVISWKDPNGAPASGDAIAFRTGTAAIQIDYIECFQQSASAQAPITIGTQSTDMIRYNDTGNTPAGQIYIIDRDKTDKWVNEQMREIRVKMK